jgi:hypothetical protein
MRPSPEISGERPRGWNAEADWRDKHEVHNEIGQRDVHVRIVFVAVPIIASLGQFVFQKPGGLGLGSGDRAGRKRAREGGDGLPLPACSQRIVSILRCAVPSRRRSL